MLSDLTDAYRMETFWRKLVVVTFLVCHVGPSLTLVNADLTSHHNKREPESAAGRLDYFGVATARGSGNGLRYVGCYDAWDHNLLSYTATLWSHSNTLEECRKKCTKPYAFILLKGKYCNCMKWDAFTNTHVRDEYCDVECPGDPTSICGGHYEFSVYCDSLGESGDKCSKFVVPPIEDLHPPPKTLEIRKKGSYLVGHLEPIYPCVKCSSAMTSCVTSSIQPWYDYIPENTPSICADFCSRPVSYLHTGEEVIRPPMKYAFIGWDTRMTSTGWTEISVCKCSDTIFDNFIEISEESCTKVCPDSPDDDDMCGSEQKGTFTVYCADPNGCILETPPSSSSTTQQSRTTEMTTEPQPPSDTSKSSPYPTEEIVTSKPTVSPTEGQTRPASTMEPTSTTPEYHDPPGPVCSPACSGTDSYGHRWTGCPGRTARKPCPNTDDSSSRRAKWYCTPLGVFEGDHPDMRDCRTDWVEKVKEDISGTYPIPPDEANQLLQFIETEMSEASYFGHEINDIIGSAGIIVRRLPDDVNPVTFGELTDKSIEIGSQALANQRPWLEISHTNRSRTLSNLFNVIEDTLYKMAQNEIQHGSTENAGTTFIKSHFSTGGGHGVKAEISGRILTYPFDKYSEPNRIVLPTSWPNALEGEHVYYQGISISKESVENLLPFSEGFEANHTTSTSFTALNTNIIGFVLNGSTSAKRMGRGIEFPDAGVTITLKHEVEAWGNTVKTLRRKLHDGEKVAVALGSAKCVYWDTEKLEWSSSGCKLIRSDRYNTVCECSHLTSFAVLFDTHSYTSKQLGLEILTIVLCSLSVVCLLSTIVIFKILRSTHSSRTTITSNLAGCLLVGNSLVLIVMDRHYFDMSEGVCAAAGVLIHYAFLSAFMWMGIEGYYLYKLMIHVFDSGSDHLRMYRILGYGVPILIVGTTGAVAFLKGEDAYGGDMFCWLQGHYVWAFLVPVAVVVVLNSIILFITLRTAYQVKTSTAQSQDRIKSYKTWARGCLSLSFLLGLTWTIGFLITLDHYTGSLVFAYIFTVLNGAQGIWLFTFHCLLNEKVAAAAARRNINLPSWLSASDPKSGGHQPASPSYLGSRSKTNIKTVFGGIQSNDAARNQVIEVPKEHNESILQTRRRSYTLKDTDLRKGKIAEDSGETISSDDSYRTSTTDAASSGSDSPQSSEGSQRKLIVERRKSKI